MARKFGIGTAAVIAVAAMGLSACSSDSGDDSKKDDKVASDKTSAGDQGNGGGGDKEDGSGGTGSPNGIEKLSGPEIARKSGEALSSVTSMRVKTVGAKEQGSTDLMTDTSGNCLGTSSFQDLDFRVIKKGEQVWLKPGDSYWTDKAGQQVLAKEPRAKGKYFQGELKSSITLGLTAALCLAQPDTMSKSLLSAKQVTKGAPTTVDGKKVVPITFAMSGEKPSTVHIATEGKPYPVSLTQKSDLQGDLQGRVGLSGFGVRFTVKAPSAAESIDVSKVEGAYPSTG
ncbi:hypothetical protein [Streptomyces cucumeris]|uniref:hypothetical protein n=1 Tax=Streptomyces cucumeris TaxID=2962890 RepID=UPI003D736BCE